MGRKGGREEGRKGVREESRKGGGEEGRILFNNKQVLVISFHYVQTYTNSHPLRLIK